MKKLTLLLIVVVVVLSAVLSACQDNPCANGSACGLLSDDTDVEKAIKDYVKDTCPKRADGTCKTMGEK